MASDWLDGEIAQKENEALKKIVEKLKDPSFLAKKGREPSLVISSASGSGDKLCSIGVCFDEKGSKELQARLEARGYKKTRRAAKNSGIYSRYEDTPREYRIYMEKPIRYDKYAIYKKKDMMFAMTYIDSMYDYRLKNIIGGYSVKEDSLPIVVNGVGGRHSFLEEEERKSGFVEIVEVLEDEEPLTLNQMYPKNSDEFHYGWIDPSGNTYSCSFEDHISCADKLAKRLGIKTFNGERALEELGWVKISRPAPYNYENLGKRAIYFSSSEGRRMTKQQIDVIMEKGIYEEDDHAKWLIDMELDDGYDR